MTKKEPSSPGTYRAEKQSRRLLPYLCSFVVGCAAGYLFKKQQLYLVSPALPSRYPWALWAYPILTGGLAFLVVASGASLLLRARRYCRGRHALALMIFTLAQVSLNGVVSPYLAPDPILALAKHESKLLPVTSYLQRQDYIAAKRLDFSEFDPSYWGGVGVTPTGYSSKWLAFYSLVTDRPAVDVRAFYRGLQLLMLLWCIAGSMGCYLFGLEALGLSYFCSLLGGTLFVFSNFFLAVLFNYYFPAFVGPFLTLPWALWAWHRSLRRSDLRWAATAGVLLAVPAYLVSSHPDSVAQALAFFALFAAYGCCRAGEVSSWPRRLTMVATTGATFAAVSAYALLPLALSLVRKEIHFFGHQELMHHGIGELKAMFWPILYSATGPALLLALERPHRGKEHGYFLFFVVFAVASFLFIGPGRDGWGARIWERFSLPHYFFNLPRTLLYFGFSLLMASLASADAFLTAPVTEKAEAWLASGKRLRSAHFGIALLPMMFSPAASLLAEKAPRLLVSLPAVTLILLLIVLVSGHEKHPRGRRWFVLSILGLTLLVCTSHQWAYAGHDYNPNGCETYLPLSAQVSNYRALGFRDRASLRFLRERLQRFERDSGLTPRFRARLAALGVSSAAALPLDRVLALAGSEAREIDDFYIERAGCLYTAVSPSDRARYFSRTAYGDAAIFDPTKERFHRILGATKTYSHFGTAEGYLVHNALMTTDPRYMTSYPPLSALYLIPGELYRRTGTYDSPSAWTPGVEALAEPLHRKLFEIGGIDTYVLETRDFSQLADKHDLEPIPYDMPPQLRPPFTVVHDRRSYGQAFLATRVHQRSPLSDRLWRLRPPFRGPEELTTYAGEVRERWRELMALSSKGEVIVETASQRVPLEESGVPTGNRLSIAAISGNKAVFEVHCASKPCLLVWNEASLAGWKAFADGLPLTVKRVNFAFMGVQPPPGDSLVWFEYWLPGRVLGTWITLGALLVCLWWWGGEPPISAHHPRSPLWQGRRGFPGSTTERHAVASTLRRASSFAPEPESGNRRRESNESVGWR